MKKLLNIILIISTSQLAGQGPIIGSLSTNRNTNITLDTAYILRDTFFIRAINAQIPLLKDSLEYCRAGSKSTRTKDSTIPFTPNAYVIKKGLPYKGDIYPANEMSPGIYDHHLVIIYGDFIEWQTTCQQYKDFKKLFPEFQIPSRTLARFNKCNVPKK